MTQTVRQRRHQETKREILDAAWAQAEQVGIAAISLRELAAAVGMRAPSLYTYFPSKDAMYDEMFAEGYRALDVHMAVVLARAPADRRAALALGAEEFVAFCQASPARYQIMFTRAIPGWEPSPAAYAVSIASYERSGATLAGLGVETDEGRDLYIAIVAGLAAQQMANEPEGDRWRRLAGEAMEMLSEHLHLDEEATG